MEKCFFFEKKSFDENNKLLISHAVKLVEHALKVSLINAGKEAHEDFFCCVTLTKWDNVDEINCITPNIYITRRRKWLFSYINLKKTSSKQETLALKYIHELGLYNYDVYISGESDDIRRVYIINDIYSQIISPNDDVV